MSTDAQSRDEGRITVCLTPEMVAWLERMGAEEECTPERYLEAIVLEEHAIARIAHADWR